MPTHKKLRVVILKPSKYDPHGFVERFRLGFMPNSTVPYLRSMTPAEFEGASLEVHAVDEYVQTDLEYLRLLEAASDPTLVAFVGVQSHQLHRSLDLAAYALRHGVAHVVIGGPHPMTCDTSMLQNRGVSFALAEAEMVWSTILHDALAGQLQPVYGQQQRWQKHLDAPVLVPPSRRDLRRYIIPMLGVYPARGCPFTCNFCSVIKIAGRQIRSQSIETTLASLRAARDAGVHMVMFTSDNFNKYREAPELLRAMIGEGLRMPFFVQCDTQIARQEEFVDLLARAGCFQMFVGVESFNRQVLLEAKKFQNFPERYGQIIGLCRARAIATHFSNIIGFPADTREGILEHLNVLRQMAPDVASFYILTPIPGTEQYDDFMARGLITEKNLDRFDGSTPTWQHPHLGGKELTDLLYHCYRSFYTPLHVSRRSVFGYRGRGKWFVVGTNFGYSIFARYSGWRRMHPMSGGIWRVAGDHARDYLALRKDRFGFELAPLPQSLTLSAADQAFNESRQSAAGSGQS